MVALALLMVRKRSGNGAEGKSGVALLRLSREEEDSMSGPQTLHRRGVIAGSVALLGAAAIPARAAADQALAPAGDLLGKVRSFMSGLDDEQRKAASFAWSGSEWRGWNYFGATGYIKPGLRLEQMNAAQKDA